MPPDAPAAAAAGAGETVLAAAVPLASGTVPAVALPDEPVGVHTGVAGTTGVAGAPPDPPSLRPPAAPALVFFVEHPAASPTVMPTKMAKWVFLMRIGDLQ